MPIRPLSRQEANFRKLLQQLQEGEMLLARPDSSQRTFGYVFAPSEKGAFDTYVSEAKFHDVHITFYGISVAEVPRPRPRPQPRSQAKRRRRG